MASLKSQKHICDIIICIRRRSGHDGVYKPTFLDILEVVNAINCSIMCAHYALLATNGDHLKSINLIKECGGICDEDTEPC